GCEQFVQIARAYETLRNPAKRSAYDARQAHFRLAARKRRQRTTLVTTCASFAATLGAGLLLAVWLNGSEQTARDVSTIPAAPSISAWMSLPAIDALAGMRPALGKAATPWLTQAALRSSLSMPVAAAMLRTLR